MYVCVEATANLQERSLHPGCVHKMCIQTPTTLCCSADVPAVGVLQNPKALQLFHKSLQMGANGLGGWASQRLGSARNGPKPEGKGGSLCARSNSNNHTGATPHAHKNAVLHYIAR